MIQIISTKVYRKYQQLFVIQNILETCPLSNVKTKYKSNEELSITIELFSIEEEIVISVQDNGVGLAPEKLQLINSQLLSNLNDRSLSILNVWLMAEHHGELVIESEINQFTRTICHLPKDE